MSAFFSIIMPTYNRAHLIGKAIESVLAQTFTGWELIVVDDGSTDNTRAVVASYNDPRIHYVYQQNAERSAARNKGISHARGQYICFLDSDDYYLPDRLEKLHTFLSKNTDKGALFITDMLVDNGKEQKTLHLPELAHPENVADYFALNTVFCQQVCAPAKVFSNHLFNPLFRIGEDFELWLRISAEFPVVKISDAATVVISEHEDRSVNIKKHNSAVEQRTMYHYAFKAPHAGSHINSELKKMLLSNSYLNSAKYFMANQKKNRAIIELCKSIIFDLKNQQTRHKLWCLGQLLRGRLPQQYQ
jgi:glycosyltransferase involved in cell wall biosynthesis